MFRNTAVLRNFVVTGQIMPESSAALLNCIFIQKNFFREKQSKTEQTKEKQSFSNNRSIPSLIFAEKYKKTVDICMILFYIES